MELSLAREQVALVEAVRKTVERCVDRTPLSLRALDRVVYDELGAGGLLDVLAAGGSQLDAVLVVDAVGRAGVCAPVAARVLVAPVLLGSSAPEGIVALADRPAAALVRFGGEADEILLLDGATARRLPAAQAEVTDADLPQGYPVARVTSPVGADGIDLGPDSGAQMRRLWQVGLAAEAGGLMAGAVLLAARHVKERHQFGRPIGSYQAVQHRLALAHVAAEGVRWLARWAAWHPDNDELAAAAATHAQVSAREVVRHVHQVAGAIGITQEFGLTRYTGKLTLLASELGGPAASARTLAQARWGAGTVRRPAPGYRGRGQVPLPVLAGVLG